MDALRSSCSEKVIGNSCCGGSGVSISRTHLLRPAQIRFVLKLDSGVSISGRSTSLETKQILSSSSSLSGQAKADAETVDTQTQSTHQSKTVHVKFKLQRECRFGQQFLLAGEDPIFGLWDPENAIVLDWSEGHVWTVKLDVPVEKTFQFKFILKGINGEIAWQPGPDRSFRSWETKNTIVISEDWGNAELQQITEEPMTILTEESAAVATWQLVAGLMEESVSNPEEELVVNPTRESVSNLTNDTSDHAVVSNSEAVTNESQTSVKDDVIPNSHEIPVVYEVGPVLVPGLALPAPELATEETHPKEVMIGSFVSAADGAINKDVPQLPGKQEANTSKENQSKEASMSSNALLEEKLLNGRPEEMASDVGPEEMASHVGPEERGSDVGPEERGSEDGPEERNLQAPAIDVFGNDIHWAGKALQKLILNLCFLKNQQLN